MGGGGGHLTRRRRRRRRSAVGRALLRAGVLAYAALLRLYPPDFRGEWSGVMLALFGRRSLHALRRRGVPGLLAWWARTGADLARSLVVEWRERWTERRRGEMTGDLFLDARLAVRRLFRAPLWTVTALATLTVGIGGVTGMFSLVYDSLIRPLPLEEPERLVSLRAEHLDYPEAELRFSLPLIEAWEAAAPGDLVVGGWARGVARLHLEDGPIYVPSAWATGGLFDVLGVQPILGRRLEAADAVEGAAPVVAVSETLWRSRFGADPSIIGGPVELGETIHTVVAVVGPELDALVPDARFWVPTADFSRNPDVRVLDAVGRIPGGRSLDVVQERLSAAPVQDPTGAAYVGRIEPLQRALVGDTRPVLLTFMALVAGLLLIASVNLANLLLGRASARDGERGIREALGASRGRLLRQNLVDGVVLAVAGGTGGLLLGMWLRRMVLAWSPTGVSVAGGGPIPDAGAANGGPGGVEAAFALLVAVTLCTTLAVWSATRARAPGPVLRAGGSRSSADRRLTGSQRFLTVAQVAVTFVLLTGSVVLLRNVLRLTSTEPGFATETVGGLAATLPESPYPDASAQAAAVRRLAARIEAIPGVVRAAAADRPPLRGYAYAPVEVEGVESPERASRFAERVRVDEGFFAAMSIPLVAGRPFGPADVDGAPRVAVVSETFVRRYLPGGAPLGRRIRFGGEEEPWRTIVGVTPDVRLRGPAHEAGATVFEPLAQTGGWDGYFNIVYGTRGPATDVLGAVRATLRAVEPEAALLEVGSYAQWLRRAPGYAEARFRALVANLLGGVALLLALVGVYGVAAYQVRRRTRELGIRMALGARPGRLVSGVLREALLLTAVGVALGGGGAWLLVALLEPFLLSVPARDPVTFAAVAALLAAVSVAASTRPALTAAGVAPVEALRAE